MLVRTGLFEILWQASHLFEIRPSTFSASSFSSNGRASFNRLYCFSAAGREKLGCRLTAHDKYTKCDSEFSILDKCDHVLELEKPWYLDDHKIEYSKRCLRISHILSSKSSPIMYGMFAEKTSTCSQLLSKLSNGMQTVILSKDAHQNSPNLETFLAVNWFKIMFTNRQNARAWRHPFSGYCAPVTRQAQSRLCFCWIIHFAPNFVLYLITVNLMLSEASFVSLHFPSSMSSSCVQEWSKFTIFCSSSWSLSAPSSRLLKGQSSPELMRSVWASSCWNISSRILFHSYGFNFIDVCTLHVAFLGWLHFQLICPNSLQF